MIKPKNKFCPWIKGLKKLNNGPLKNITRDIYKA